MDTLFTLIIGLVLIGLVSSWFLAPEGWARLMLAAGRKLAGLRSNNTAVDGTKWHYLVGGRGPMLVAIHGFGGDADHWLRVAPTLRRHFTIMAPDLVGFGESACGDQLPFHIDAQVDRLMSLVEQLGIDEFVVAGSSMGGWIASRLAQRYPDRIKALWLLGPLGVQECTRGELLQRIDRGESSPLSVSSIGDFEELVFRPMFAKPPHLPRPLKIHYGSQAVARAAASRRMFSEVASSKPALETVLSEVPAPILVQWGTRDLAVHVSGAERLQEVIINGSVILQPDIGHLPMLEAAGLTSKQFMEFARDHGLLEERA